MRQQAIKTEVEQTFKLAVQEVVSCGMQIGQQDGEATSTPFHQVRADRLEARMRDMEQEFQEERQQLEKKLLLTTHLLADLHNEKVDDKGSGGFLSNLF